MCGIVGVVAKAKIGMFKVEVDLFKQLLLVDQVRGTDGTGVIFDIDKGIKYLKAPFGAGGFLSQDNFKHAMDEVAKKGHFIIGHNRAATKGEKVWANTHPFNEGAITLVHNGTLWSHKNLDDKVAVDSHAICSHMAINGAEATLKEIDGAFALVWVDELNNTINMARNYERPLHLVETEKVWIISSELGLGLWMADRHNQKVVNSFQLETETLYTFDIDDMATYTTKKVEYMQEKVYNVAGFFPEIGAKAGTGSFSSRREEYKWQKKEKRAQQKAGGKVIPFVPKKTIPPMRVFGEPIKFAPDRLAGNDLSSSIVFDQMKEMYFMFGKVYNEPDTEVRVYGPNHGFLAELAKNDLLEGSVISTRIKGSKVSYNLISVSAVELFPTLNDAVAEAALTTWCNKNGVANDPHALIKCDVCSEETPRELVTIFKGKPLCDTCYTAFSSNPKMAEEMGYC